MGYKQCMTKFASEFSSKVYICIKVYIFLYVPNGLLNYESKYLDSSFVTSKCLFVFSLCLGNQKVYSLKWGEVHIINNCSAFYPGRYFEKEMECAGKHEAASGRCLHGPNQTPLSSPLSHRLVLSLQAFPLASGCKDPLEKEMATQSSILAWKIPWTEEPGRLQSMGSPRVGHRLATKPPLAVALSAPFP